MNVLRHTDRDFQERLRQATAASSLFNPEIERRARDIIDAVRQRGDDALIEFTERFDGARLRPDQLAVTRAEILSASLKADPALRAAVRDAERNVAAFARKSLRRDWEFRNSHGARVGEKFDPIQRVGVYIPGGAAPLVSTALMTAALAKVAGCPEIVVCTPCNKDGSVNPALLFAARAAGATEIYRVGGAQAIAAMAFGTPTIRRVLKIAGPGNAYVVAAKRLVFGHVSIDSPPGPSEVLVLADDSADPRFVAADLLAQAEHGSGHERVWLVTPSAQLIRRVEKEMNRQLPMLERCGYIEQVLNRNTWLIHVKTIDAAIDVTNQFAPEHCEVIARNARKIAQRIVTAGAIFLGPWSPTALGDYVAGPSHTLPTGGSGAAFPGLTVDQFQRRTSLAEYDRASVKKALPALKQLASLEGLGAHAESVEIRVRPMQAGRALRARRGKTLRTS